MKSLLLRLIFLYQFAFEILSLFPTAGLGAATDEGAIRSENAMDLLWAAATFVVDVVGRAGRIVGGSKRTAWNRPRCRIRRMFIVRFLNHSITTLLSIV